MKKIANDRFWIKQEADEYTIGLTNTGQDEFGSIGYLSLPSVGEILTAGEEFAEIEAEKAVTELVSPLSGRVTAVYEEALLEPSLLDVKNEDYAWLLKLTDVDAIEFDSL